MTDPIDRIGVVVPALNEQDQILGCLTALGEAAAVVEQPVRIVVVCGGSVDATADLARQWGAEVIEGPACPVGTARDLGVRRLLGGKGLWLATTDADSRVPGAWLADHLAAACDAFVGTVDLSPVERAAHPAWVRAYENRVGTLTHEHAHGANLGLRATWYVRVGGFGSQSCGEDADLVDRLTHAGAHVVRSSLRPVLTSARHVSRVDGGVATDLAASP